MQVGIDVTYMYTNFGGCDLFGFGDIGTFKNDQIPLLVHIMVCLITVLHVQVYCVLLLCSYNVIIHVHYICAHVYYVFIIATI